MLAQIMMRKTTMRMRRGLPRRRWSQHQIVPGIKAAEIQSEEGKDKKQITLHQV
jgi:hypothetical protein